MQNAIIINVQGVIAQLGECLTGSQEVRGSIPLNSTIHLSEKSLNRVTFFVLLRPISHNHRLKPVALFSPIRACYKQAPQRRTEHLPIPLRHRLAPEKGLLYLPFFTDSPVNGSISSFIVDYS